MISIGSSSYKGTCFTLVSVFVSSFILLLTMARTVPSLHSFIIKSPTSVDLLQNDCKALIRDVRGKEAYVNVSFFNDSAGSNDPAELSEFELPLELGLAHATSLGGCTDIADLWFNLEDTFEIIAPLSFGRHKLPKKATDSSGFTDFFQFKMDTNRCWNCHDEILDGDTVWCQPFKCAHKMCVSQPRAHSPNKPFLPGFFGSHEGIQFVTCLIKWVKDEREDGNREDKRDAVNDREEDNHHQADEDEGYRIP